MNTLQHIIFPEAAICTEHHLYYKIDGAGGFSSSDQSIRMSTGALLELGTYFNLFSIAKWGQAGALGSLSFSLDAIGTFELRIIQALPDKSWDTLFCDVISFSEKSRFDADLSHFSTHGNQGVIAIEIRSLGDTTVVFGGKFQTDREPESWPKLAISITTFKREQEVETTVERLSTFLEAHPIGQHIQAYVVDNGKSVEIANSEHVSVIENRNLGGAGGFARGLIQAENEGFSHVLFMDDDASFHMENIYRTYMFLALTNNPKAAVAGAMINNTHKWRMWENGAIFNKTCRPQFIGTDLREQNAVMKAEFESASRIHAKGYYGGWWFFAFPVSQVEHYPFPFFVRGDDVNFSLANDFDIYTINGVVSFQDDFTEKESPLTLYLDLRGHLLHHMLFEYMDIGAFKTLGIVWHFLRRSLERFHYETAEAQLLSFADVMRGPAFFDQNIDMSQRRQDVKALTKNEYWKPMAEVEVSERRLIPAHNHITNTVMEWTLNGHFMLFSNYWMNHYVIPIHHRGMVWPAWGGTQLTFVNANRDMGYTVKQSKKRFFGLFRRYLGLAIKFLFQYRKLRDAYREAYPRMTSKAYWMEATHDK